MSNEIAFLRGKGGMGKGRGKSPVTADFGK